MILYYAISIENNNLLYGPGNRVVLWTQGCSIRCYGCSNYHLFSTCNAKKISGKEFVTYCRGLSNIEGITFLGGEPSDQIIDLLPVMKQLRTLGLSIITFTGHEIEWFKTDVQKEFVSNSDIIVCGPYKKELQNLYLHFRGSSNQTVIKTSSRYIDYEIKDGTNVLLLEINNNGIIINKGFPNDEFKEVLHGLISETEIYNDS